MKTIAVGDLGEFWYGDYKEPFVQLEGAVPGYPAGVVLKDDMGKLLCAYCGKTTENLGNHARIHGMTARAYKTEVGLLQGSALVSERVRQHMIARGLRAAAEGNLSPGRPKPFIASRGAANKRRPEALNKTGRCLAQIIEVARTVARENKGNITHAQMARHGIWQSTMDHYGGLRRIAEYANVPYKPKPRSQSDNELLTKLRELAHELGRTPSESDLRRYGLPCNVTYKNRFGLYSEACRRAGLVANLPVPVDRSDEVAILVAYATTGNSSVVAKQVHRTNATVRAVLVRYGVPLLNPVSVPEATRYEAREWAAEVARRITDWPDQSVA